MGAGVKCLMYGTVEGQRLGSVLKCVCVCVSTITPLNEHLLAPVAAEEHAGLFCPHQLCSVAAGVQRKSFTVSSLIK